MLGSSLSWNDLIVQMTNVLQTFDYEEVLVSNSMARVLLNIKASCKLC